jgi:hypothetical protein
MAMLHTEIGQGTCRAYIKRSSTVNLRGYLFSFGGIQAMGILQEFPLSMQGSLHATD